MTARQRIRVGVILGLTVLSLILVLPTFYKDVPSWWPTKPIRLGLDLKGGSYLVLGVETEEAVKSQLSAVANSIRSELRRSKAGVVRARQIGTRELQVTLLSDSGSEALQKYVRENHDFLRQTNVEKSGRRTTVTYEINPAAAEEIKKNAVLQAIETIRNRVDLYGVAEPLIQRTGENRVMVQLPDITNLDTVKETIGSVAKLEFRLVADVNKPADETVSLPSRDGGRIRVEQDVLMTGDAIDNARVEINPQTNEREVSLSLNAFGRRTFARITSDNVGRQLAIVLDGVVQSYPVIREAITGGTASISGGFSPDEVRQLAVVLRAGALPAPLTFEEQRTVGASLGADAIRSSVNAMAAGSLAVVLFVLFYYRKSGALAVGCLALNLLFIMALLYLLGATLTLPGIAGLVLTVGMAVDANVIIFERIREERRAGLTPNASIEAGFDRAHWTILDANLTSLITGVVLYSWGTGPIKGFAVTLCLGVLTSMFCALFVSRVGFEVLNLRNSRGEVSI